MTLRWQTIPIPFGHGLAQEAVPSMLGPGKLATAEQGHIDKLGSIQVRPGFQALTTDVFFDPAPLWITTITAIHRLIGHGYETLVSDGARLYSYSEANEQWRDVDYVYEGQVADRIMGERGRDTFNSAGDVVYCNGYLAHAWYDHKAGKMMVRFVDGATRARFPSLALDDEATTVEDVRVLAAGDLVHVIFHSSTSLEIVAYTFDTTDLETSYNTFVSHTIGTNCSAGGVFDAYCDGNKIYLAYDHTSGAANSIRTMKMDLDLGTVVDTFVTASVGRNIAVTGRLGQYVWVVYTPVSGSAPDGLVYFALTESSMALAVAPMTVDDDIYDDVPATPRIGVVSTGSDAIIVYEIRNNTGPVIRTPEMRARWVDALGNLGDGNITHRIGILSKPIIIGTEPYVVGYYHERSHAHNTNHEAPGYPNRYGYLLHIPTATCQPLDLVDV